MSKIKKRVAFKPHTWFFYSKYWLTGRMLFLVLVGVASREYPWLQLVFFALGVYWAVQLLVGLCRGKYTGVR